MNIHHRHTIHVCSACSCCPGCPTHGGAKPSEPEERRPRSSILEAIGNLARFAALISLLRATAGGNGHQTTGEVVPAEPIAPPTPTEPSNTDSIVALFAQSAAEHEHPVSAADVHRPSPSTEVKPPIPPLVAAFLAALRDEPNPA